MSNSNLVDLRAWRTPRYEARKQNFASTHETLQLLRAFCAIESSVVRSEIIKIAQNAAPAGPRPPENAA
jgi:hypothetical protein